MASGKELHDPKGVFPPTHPANGKAAKKPVK